MKALTWFWAIVTALSVYLVSVNTPVTRGIGITVFLISAASIFILYYYSRRYQKEVYRLQQQITDFLEGRVKTPRFSVDDDSLALLENAVVELEDRLLYERGQALLTRKKHADFIADVSHQLKTPLAALKLYCEMDQASNSGAHAQKQLTLIEHMEQLVQSLLRLEKLRANVYELRYERHDLSQLCRDVWAELQPLYPEKQFNVTGSAVMRCDAYWVKEALLNIIKNACEHTLPDGQIQVALETFEASIVLAVEDNGGGMAETELPKLFHRFYRSSHTMASGGAGLGLAIAKTIVEKHHGTIYAENTAKGLRMTICFPLMDGVLAIN